MHDEIRVQWIKALRSGSYERSLTANLKSYSEAYGEFYSVWGVLCDIVDPAGWKKAHSELFRGRPWLVHDCFAHRGQIHEPLPYLKSLAGINDYMVKEINNLSTYGFDTVAKYLENIGEFE